jgi:hypothetical protein
MSDDTPIERPYRFELRTLRERVERLEFLTYLAVAMAGGMLLGLIVAIVVGIARH